MTTVYRRVWDRIGVFGSGACIAHCLLLPLVVPMVPLLSGLAESEWVHITLLALLGLSALAAFVPGYRTHRAVSVLVIGFVGVVLLSGGVLAHEYSAAAALNAPLTVVGGIALISAHLINIKLCRECPVCREEMQPAA